MKLYQMIDGTLAGFYQEEGRAVQALQYRDVYEQVCGWKTMKVEEKTADTYETIWAGEHCDIVTRICYPAGWVSIVVPGEWKLVEKTLWVCEEVYVGQEPVYSYADPALLGDWEIGELMPGVVDVPEFTDVIIITNTLTGEEFRTTAKYLGMATRIDDNEFVVPP